ncbi:unnamed protein product [Linum trigynum]|uniref:Reverse transcriptase domain-containing protein n=1 Tax=Linum trigynum TaxID=586398 RepID=A0AAV2CKN8_9ROSI
MRKLVFPRQSSFIPWRETTDNIIVLQEALHTLRKKKGKRGGIVMKIDLEKHMTGYDGSSCEILFKKLASPVPRLVA